MATGVAVVVGQRVTVFTVNVMRCIVCCVMRCTVAHAAIDNCERVLAAVVMFVIAHCLTVLSLLFALPTTANANWRGVNCVRDVVGLVTWDWVLILLGKSFRTLHAAE